MNTLERNVASRLLEARERGGYRFGSWLRGRMKSRLLGIAYIAVGSGVAAVFGLWNLFLPIVGIIVGMWLRDFSYFVASNRSWHVLNYLLDWDKVERMVRNGGKDVEPTAVDSTASVDASE